mgnify:CR=1 FL=1
MQGLKVISEEYSHFLGLNGFPVAIKMLSQSSDVADLRSDGRPIRKLSKRLLICQVLAQARFYGRVLVGEEENINLCRLGADALGFAVDDYTHVYSGTYFSNREAAMRMIETMPKLERGKYHALLVSPLEKSPIDPDVVVFFGNAAQILRIINGYLFDKGGRLEFSTSGDAGVCCDPVVIPMQTGKPSIGIPCNGGRLMSVPNETDLVCGVPFDILEQILDGIKFTATRVPVRYPPAWQHIDWEPQPPVLYFVRPELRPGKGERT